MNEERGPPIGGLNSLVVFLLYHNIFFTIILLAYDIRNIVTNSVAAVSAEFYSLLLLNDF